MESVRVARGRAVDAVPTAAVVAAEAAAARNGRPGTPASFGFPAGPAAAVPIIASLPAQPAAAGGPFRFRLPAVERRLGRLLRLLRDGDLFCALGFVRLGDYVVERLGVSYRTAQEWMRTDEALERLPLAAEAFEAGEITSAHVRLLTRVARREDEGWWVALARRLGVRAFASAVAARERAAEGEAQEASPEMAAGEPAGDAQSKAGTSGATAERAPAGASPARVCVPAEDGPVAGSLEGEAAPSVPLEISAPAWLAASWRETVAFARTLAGSAISQGECLEMVLAEFGGGDLHLSASTVDNAVSSEAPASRRNLHASAPPAVEPIDARAIDRELRELMAARQRHKWSLAERLRGMAMTRWLRGDGFRSLEEYGRDRLGLSARRVYYLLSLQRTLDRLPLLRRAFLDGRVTLKQVLLAGSVATVVTEAGWIERVRSVTLRRLEDEVCFWRHLKDVRPAVWETLDGGPLPEGIVLVPGREPRLHASAGSQARQFLEALEEDERTVPMPDHIVRIRLRVEPEVNAMWEGTVARCRASVGPEIKEWEILALALAEFWRTWDNTETRRQRRENPVLERDGWRCAVPGCRAMGSGRLHDHHVTWRSHGGSDEEWNRCPPRVPHHLRGIHAGFIRCSGRAPDDLLWELGIEQGKAPFLVYRGDTRIGGVGV